MKMLTLKEWQSEGERLFGKDFMKWKFKCPSCGNVQSPEDFKEYKDTGAEPSDAYFNCIGRFSGTKNRIGSKEKPCNYTLGGLFVLSKIRIINNGKECPVFEFAVD